MKSALASLTAGLTLGRVLTVAFGMALIVRCEMNPIAPIGWVGCWVAGGSVAGIKGLAEIYGAGKYREGLYTYNPALKRPEDDEPAVKLERRKP